MLHEETTSDKVTGNWPKDHSVNQSIGESLSQSPNRPLIGVICRWSDETPATLSLCELVGAEIAKRNAILITGGGPGGMEAACRGAKTAGGQTLGILAGRTRESANSYVDIAIPTGLGFDIRSALVVRASNALIMVGGGNGTLGELSLAYLHRKPVVVLVGSGGWADRILSVLVDGEYIDERRSIQIVQATSPSMAASLAVALSSTCLAAGDTLGG